MNITINNLYISVALLSTLLSVIVALKAFVLRSKLLGNYNLFFYFFITDALFDITGAIFFFNNTNNTILLDLFSIIGFLLIAPAFLKYLILKSTKRIFIVLIIITTLIAVYWIYDPAQMGKLDLIPMTLQSSVQVFMSAIVLYNLSSSPEVNIFKSTVFWFALGVFIYSLIDCVITSGLNFLDSRTEFTMAFIYIGSPLVNIAKLVCFLKGLNQLKQ